MQGSLAVIRPARPNSFRTNLTLGVLALLAAVLLASTDAVAKDRIEVKPESFVSGFRLKGSNGYDIVVTAYGHKRIALTASKGLGEATYTTRGHASSTGIEADFGTFGRIAVRFDGSAVPPPRSRGFFMPRIRCQGQAAVRQRGAFHGSIRFAGENDFTEVDGQEARGGFVHAFRRVCHRPSHKRAVKLPPKFQTPILSDTLILKSKPGSPHTELLVNSSAIDFGRGKPEFLLAMVAANSRERVGAVAIKRGAFTVGGPSFLRASETGTYPVVATVKLPKPFTGSATYRKDRGLPPSWTGTLSVSLPGAGSVPLTGESFEPDLCRATTLDALKACIGHLATNSARALVLGAAQGSGSQSQAFWDVRLSWSR